MEVAAEIIERLGGRQRAGQPAGDITGEAFVGDVAGMPLDQVARRKPRSREVILI
jgi:hypothetical protein